MQLVVVVVVVVVAVVVDVVDAAVQWNSSLGPLTSPGHFAALLAVEDWPVAAAVVAAVVVVVVVVVAAVAEQARVAQGRTLGRRDPEGGSGRGHPETPAPCHSSVVFQDLPGK